MQKPAWAVPSDRDGVRPLSGETSAVQDVVRAVGKFLHAQPLGSICGAGLLAVVIVAALASVIAPYSPTANDAGPALVGPGLHNLFGTDQFGRDIFSRVVYGARISLYVGLGATLVGVVGATAIGMVSAYAGGAVDYCVQRVVDAAQSIPPLVLLIGVVMVLGPSLNNLVIALAVRQSFSLSRVIRGSVFAIRKSAYVEGAAVIGASHARILIAYILPNIMPSIIVLFSTAVGGAIVAEASLSFLGFGVPPPAPSWGGMMSAEGRSYMLVDPWILIFPTLALGLVVYATNMFGDAVRDELDPQDAGHPVTLAAADAAKGEAAGETMRRWFLVCG